MSIGAITLTIDEATERLIDYRGKTPTKTTSGIKLITAKVIKDGRILDERSEYIASDFYDQWMRRGLPQRHDVLITTEAPMGEVAILKNSERVALAQRVILLRADERIVHSRYLFWFVRRICGRVLALEACRARDTERVRRS